MSSTVNPCSRRTRRTAVRKSNTKPAPILSRTGQICWAKELPSTAKMPTETEVLAWIEELSL